MINITNKENCTGCYACKNVCPKDCINMKNDYEGFWYPEVDMGTCIDCGLCESVCPIVNKKQIKNKPKAYACYNKNEKIRLESSSGGLFTLFAEKIICNDGVVFGARFDDEFNVVHDYVETIEELQKFRGSKYVQSKIGNTYTQVRDFLNQGRKVLFTGTPCQIGGLRSYLQKKYDNLFCIDIICHGVPSVKVWRKYLAYQGVCHGSSPWRIAFRRKDEGWKRFSISLLFNNNTEYLENHKKDLYMKAFLKNICLRPSCYACNFKTIHRESDITLADFWGIQNISPEMDDDKGTSLVFINSTNGEEIFNEIRDQISYCEVDIEKAVSYNTAAIKSVPKNKKRNEFLKMIDLLSFDKLVNKYCSDSILVKFKNKIKILIKNFLRNMGLFDAVKKILYKYNFLK